MSQDDSQRQFSGRYIDFPVREEFIPQVTELLADLERDARGPMPAPEPAPEARFGREIVMRMYLESEDRHRELLKVLAEQPGEWLYTAEIAPAVGIESGSKGMAGMFGAFGRRAKHRYGGLKPWASSWDPGRHEAKYRMDPQVAEWIQEAIREGGA
jgi:hypothetical protein